MDELNNAIILKDEAGNDVSFEFLDLIEYQGKEYVILLPTETSDDELGEVVILMVESSDDSDEESYIGVEDQEALDAVFSIFKEKFQNEFNFVD